MASALKLPIVYIIENNLYGISVGLNRVTAVKDLSVRAAAYGIKGINIDGNDVFKVYETVKEAVKFAREGNGPTLIECKTYRWKGHHAGDPAVEYRTREEEAYWKEKCPIKLHKKYLLENSILDEEGINKIEADINDELKGAVEFAKSSPFPEAAEAFECIFSE